MTTPTVTPRDFCGNCHALMDTTTMLVFEGCRYCPECHAAILADRDAFYASPAAIVPGTTRRV